MVMVLILPSVNRDWCDFSQEQGLRRMSMFYQKEHKNLLKEKSVVCATK